jgi:hypothetical protein
MDTSKRGPEPQPDGLYRLGRLECAACSATAEVGVASIDRGYVYPDDPRCEACAGALPQYEGRAM